MVRRKKLVWPKKLREILLKKQNDIRKLLYDSPKTEDLKKLEKYIRDLEKHIGSEISKEDVIEFIAQYLIIYPVQCAIFDPELLEKNYINQRTIKLLGDLNISLTEFSIKDD